MVIASLLHMVMWQVHVTFLAGCHVYLAGQDIISDGLEIPQCLQHLQVACGFEVCPTGTASSLVIPQ